MRSHCHIIPLPTTSHLSRPRRLRAHTGLGLGSGLGLPPVGLEFRNPTRRRGLTHGQGTITRQYNRAPPPEAQLSHTRTTYTRSDRIHSHSLGTGP